MNINNIPIYNLKTNKFKSITIKFCFISKAIREKLPYYLLLCNVLTNSSNKYNTKKKKLDLMASLYDIHFNFFVEYLYNTQVVYFKMNFVNPKYVRDDNLFDKALEVLYEFLLNPFIKDNAFEQKILLEEKNYIVDCLKKDINNKSLYAYERINKEMFDNTIFYYDNDTLINDILSINGSDLYKTYLDLLNNTEKIIYLCGDIDNNINLDEKFQKFSMLKNQLINYDLIYDYLPKQVTVKIEEMNINQSIIILGYKTTISVIDKQFEALNLFVQMFGGESYSTLFKQLREYNSLCYSVDVNLEIYKKTIFIEVGINKENYQRTVDLINKELEKYKKGIISEELFEIAKKDIINSIMENDDNIEEICSLSFENYLFKEENSINNLINKYNQITLNDIIKVANTVTLDTIFFLKDNTK